MRILLIISSISIFLLGSCKSGNHKIDFTPHDFKEQQSYENPVIKGFFPDPSICKAGDDYYLVTSSFEYFPGVPIFHSRDLVNWEHIGNVLERESQLPLENAGISGGIWAPVIRYNDGIFYMITTLMPDGRNFFVHTKDPADSWSEPVYIDQKNIDPSLFFDDDGKVYYTGTAPWDKEGPPGVYQAEIDIETGKLQTEYRHIWSGTGGRYPEGPHLYKIGKMYYLMISEGGTETGHTVTIARADNPWGPFESCPDNPILTNRNQEYSNPVQNSGHADFIQDNENKWWMVHLAVRNVNKHHHLGRETFLLPVEWDEKGWPLINQNGVSQLEVFAVPPGIQIQKDPYGRYEFNESFGPEWNYIRNPVSENYMLNEEEGLLELVGNENSLDSLDSPTFIGIRQRDFNIELTSKISFDPEKNGEEAGITAFMTPEHYYSISMIRENGKNYVIGAMKIGKIKHVSAKQETDRQIVFLKISADELNYSLHFSEDGKKWILMGSNYARLLSSETAGTFTGTYLGMFAAGNGGPSKLPAKFDFFEYRKLNR